MTKLDFFNGFLRFRVRGVNRKKVIFLTLGTLGHLSPPLFLSRPQASGVPTRRGTLPQPWIPEQCSSRAPKGTNFHQETPRIDWDSSRQTWVLMLMGQPKKVKSWSFCEHYRAKSSCSAWKNVVVPSKSSYFCTKWTNLDDETHRIDRDLVRARWASWAKS